MVLESRESSERWSSRKVKDTYLHTYSSAGAYTLRKLSAITKPVPRRKQRATQTVLLTYDHDECFRSAGWMLTTENGQKIETTRVPCLGAGCQVFAGVHILGVVVKHVVERLSCRDELAHTFRKVTPHDGGTLVL